MKYKNLIIGLLILIVAIGSSFYGGMQFQKTKSPNFIQFGDRAGGNFMMRRGASGNGSTAIRGEIQSIDNGTMTVKLDDGSSKLVLVSDSSSISKTETGALTDLKTGEKVMIFGSTNSEGIINPVTIQIGQFRTLDSQQK